MDLRHKHWALISIGVLTVILVAIIFWYEFATDSKTFVRTDTATTTPQAATTTVSTPAKPVHITEHATYYDIDLAYPSATPLVSISAAADADAVSQMKTALQDTIDQFKKDQNFANLSHDDVQRMGLDQRKEALGAEYKTYAGTHTVSYVFELYEDTLGAHPNAYYRTFTFDTRTGASLDLSDLFVSSANYLSQLSTIAAAQLPQILAMRSQTSVSDVDTDYMRNGISAKSENFQSWYVQGTKLIIVFPPYQVGPYALGTIELPIPLSQLTSLKSEYR